MNWKEIAGLLLMLVPLALIILANYKRKTEKHEDWNKPEDKKP